jgi:diaminohydroxyphosphoribosylaminopyrimidine deaminase / 5-amino-6-(5-phosphoribosylamino)uracil reductase
MARALRLAERGLYTTTPNPRVGCVIARGDEIVGEGFHERAGEPHAEIHALQRAGARARGATVYVTLEPCSHLGRTPPCADALVETGVSRVVVAMQDPNPRVAGEGLERLRAAGTAVECGLYGTRAGELNIGFVARMTRARPWLRIKTAASLDGRTALRNGRSQWITGAAARRDGHRWRARSCAVMVGVGTLLADNPRLTVRDVETPRQPLRIVVDRQLEIPLDALVLEGGNALIVTATDRPEKVRQLEQLGVQVMQLPNAEGKVDLAALMHELARRELNEVLVESGSRLNGALLRADVVDELIVYLAPHLLGDSARGMFDLGEFTALDQRIEVTIRDVRRIGSDLRIVGRLARDS